MSVGIYTNVKPAAFKWQLFLWSYEIEYFPIRVLCLLGVHAAHSFSDRIDILQNAFFLQLTGALLQ
ncbi:hypothetical protein MHH33_13045 [Paenisporosarcina sp. FSL H8-0542]|uniref:hypothetical protein n=1 Tax=Paenisporosarcina sp. FSL H8-0542 TaxID=2921401 RepID=UPI003159E113